MHKAAVNRFCAAQYLRLACGRPAEDNRIHAAGLFPSRAVATSRKK
jgi:hypothetical protein